MKLNNPVADGTQIFVRHLVAMVANIALYGNQHPQIQHLSHKALNELGPLLEREPVYTFKLVDNRLVINDMRQDQTLTAQRFNSLLTAKQISFLEVSSGISAAELLALTTHLSDQNSESGCPRFPHVQIGKLATQKTNSLSQEHAFSDIADRNCDKFLETYSGAGRQQPISATAIAEIVDDFIAAFASHSNIMHAIAPLRSMDEYAYVHSTNICLLNLAQAKLLGITGQALKDIGIAAMLHDVGKMFVPAEILNKPGRPDEGEWEMIKQHPRLGAEYLLNCPGIPYLAVISAYEHHIGYDGTGYPHSPRKRNLSICSHMTTISDIYDALRTRRSYKDSMNFGRIQQIMQESVGKSLHPGLTRSFLNAMSQVDQEGVITEASS